MAKFRVPEHEVRIAVHGSVSDTGTLSLHKLYDFVLNRNSKCTHLGLKL